MRDAFVVMMIVVLVMAGYRMPILARHVDVEIERGEPTLVDTLRE